MSGIIKPPFGAQLNLDHPLARGLVGAWLMNEGSGNKVHDYSGQGNVGTLSGFNDPPIATSGWNAGPHGGALAFDGTNDVVLIPDANALRLGTDSLSIVSQVKVLSWSTNSTPLSKRGTGAPGTNKGWGLRLASGFIGIELDDGTANSKVGNQVSSASLALLTDYNIALVIDRVQKIAMGYINGKTDGTLDISAITGSIDNINSVGIGTLPTLPYYGNIIIGFSYLYNRALSAEEVAYLYAFPYCMFDEPIYPKWLQPLLTRKYKTYHIVRDFTDNYLLREIGFGDKEWPFHVSKNLLDANTLLTDLEHRVETKATTTTTTTSSTSSTASTISTTTSTTTTTGP